MNDLANIVYNPESGEFTRKGGKKKVGYRDPRGYVQIGVNGKKVWAHRLAWFLTYGKWPDQIDHVDGDKSNNRLSNLRSVSPVEQAKNKPTFRSNSSGHRGVFYDTKRNRWRSYIHSDNKFVHLGRFKTFDEAVKARLEAEENLNFHKNHGRC